MLDEQLIHIVWLGDPDEGGVMVSAWTTRELAEQRAAELDDEGHDAYFQSLVTRTNPWAFNPHMEPANDVPGDWWESVTKSVIPAEDEKA